MAGWALFAVAARYVILALEDAAIVTGMLLSAPVTSL
jgi:hypothetical protein